MNVLFLIALRDNKSGIWFLEIAKLNHNHASILAGAYPVLRKMAMTSGIRGEKSRQLTVQIAPSKVISGLRIPDPISSIDSDNSENPRIINPIFKPRDIYNVKAQLRHEAQGPLTPIQALI